MTRPRSTVFNLDDVVQVMVDRATVELSLASPDVAEDLDTTRYTLVRRIREWTGQEWDEFRAPFMHVLHAGYAVGRDPEGMRTVKALVPASVEDELHARAAHRRTSVAAVAGEILTEQLAAPAASSRPQAA